MGEVADTIEARGCRDALDAVHVTKDSSQQLAPQRGVVLLAAQLFRLSEQLFDELFYFCKELAPSAIVHRRIVNGWALIVNRLVKKKSIIRRLHRLRRR